MLYPSKKTYFKIRQTIQHMGKSIIEKIEILAAAAKYDVSCSSSGSKRANQAKGLGNSLSCGVCHSYTEDGRCISLLKILFTNICIYDCAYCANRKSNDIPRTSFTVDEMVKLTIDFYRRNYIEGLFLSSGIIKSPNYTMDLLIQVARKLRAEEKFHGYIHMKAIPGADESLVQIAGLYADRLSVNIEIPSENSLRLLAPEKNYLSVFSPMEIIKNKIIENNEERKKFKHSPLFTPAGQSTQLIVGASPERDLNILKLASALYGEKKLKRVYYSGYLPVNEDNRLPVIAKPPLLRENRLYQADWLMRYYHYSFDEIVSFQYPDLDLKFDPKLSYALRNPQFFPIDINKADYEAILRVPGIGVQSAKLIVQARRHGQLGIFHLKKIGVVLKRAKFFIVCKDQSIPLLDLNPRRLLYHFDQDANANKRTSDQYQLSLF